jgi:hypothetical protein
MDLFWLAALLAFFAASWLLIRVVAGLHEGE